MSDKDIFSVSVKLPDDPKELERMINLLSQPHRGVMMLMEKPSVNAELLEALERMVGAARENSAAYLRSCMRDAEIVIAKAKGLKP